MASTRNRNTSIDYNLEQLKNTNYLENNLYINYGRPNNECLPELYNPSKLSRDTLSNNPVDIESTLMGIGSSNMVKPCEPSVPNLRTLKFKPFFHRDQSVIMPYPLIYDKNQRPLLS